MSEPATITFFVTGEPRTWKRPRFNRKTGAVFNAAQDRTWRDSIWGQAMPHKPELPWSAPLRVRLEFYLPIPKSWPAWKREFYQGEIAVKRTDIDNLAKAVLDALTGTFFRDDSQVADLRVMRRYELAEGPGVLVRIETLPVLPRTRKEAEAAA